MQEAIDVGGYLVNIGQNVGGVSYAWIGMFQPLLSPSKSAGWLVVTGGAAYANWANGEPSDGNAGSSEAGKENFAQMYQSGQFNDTAGTDTLHYICECDGVPADGLTLALVPPN